MKIFREFPISLLLIGLSLAASGCNETEAPVVLASVPPSSIAPHITPAILEDSQTLPTPTIATTLTPAPIPQERPRYSLAAVLDYPNHRVDVNEEILIPHPANYQLDNIVLVVPPNNWPGSISIQEISAEDLIVEGYELSGVRLNIEFREPGWRPGEVLELHIDYSLNLPNLRKSTKLGSSPFGYTTLQTNLVDWYPMFPPYEDELGWVVHDPWKFGEYLVFPAADFEVSLELGIPGLIAAASSAPLNADDPALYALENARNFVFSISPDYTVISENLNGTRVFGYSLPGYQDPGQAVFDATLEALQLYSELFGPYGQPSLSVVQGDFNYGMEYEGLYYQGKGYFDAYAGSEQSYLVTIAVHETAHQWWFGQVANDQAMEPWLDEALCTISELAYYEQLYPQSVDWWWSTRVNYYDPSGPIDRSIYDFEGFSDEYLNYRNSTYLQGANFMAALKKDMGDEQFYAFLRDYAVKFQDQIATGEDFFSLLDEYIDTSALLWMEEYFSR